MAGQQDLLTAAQNIATALNNAAKTYLNVQGTSTTESISTATVVKGTSGRFATISITTAGSTQGTVYDNNNVASTLRPVYTIPNTIGVHFVNLPMNYGIMCAPGTGQVVTVAWS